MADSYESVRSICVTFYLKLYAQIKECVSDNIFQNRDLRYQKDLDVLDLEEEIDALVEYNSSFEFRKMTIL